MSEVPLYTRARSSGWRVRSFYSGWGVRAPCQVPDDIADDQFTDNSTLVWGTCLLLLLPVVRTTVNLRRPGRARNEASTGPERLDDTRCTTYTRRVNCRGEWYLSLLLRYLSPLVQRRARIQGS